MQQLSPLDAAFLYLENKQTAAQGTFAWIYDASGCESGQPTRRALLEHMRQRLGISPILTQKVYRLPLDFDYPYWVDDESFELLYHVRELSLGERPTWEDFRRLVTQVHEQPLSWEHPLWEMTLVTGLDGIPGLPSRCFAILGKFHHVGIDGATGIKLIHDIHEPAEDAAAGHPRTTPPARKPSLVSASFRAAIRNLEATRNAVSLLKPSRSPQVSDAASAAKSTNAEQPAAQLPQAVFNGAVGDARAWDAVFLNMQDVKALRSLARGATVNDVLLAICAGGLREYLEQRDALPDAPLRAGCPINIRTAGEAASGGNMISAMVVSLHTDIGNNQQRLRAIVKSSRAAKDRAEQRGSRRILKIAGTIPAQLQAALGHGVGLIAGGMSRAVGFNCSISNLPGPQRELQLLGATLHSISVAMPVMNGYGLFVGLTTCGDRLAISLTTAADLVEDPEHLSACMVNTFSSMIRQLDRRRNTQ